MDLGVGVELIYSLYVNHHLAKILKKRKSMPLHITDIATTESTFENICLEPPTMHESEVRES